MQATLHLTLLPAESRPNVNMDCRPRSRPCNPLFKEPGTGAVSL
jgi:hypothetical protein